VTILKSSNELFDDQRSVVHRERGAVAARDLGGLRGVVGSFEEEGVLSYTLCLREIDTDRSPNISAPEYRQALLESARRRDPA
jgi:hypothetical protein